MSTCPKAALPTASREASLYRFNSDSIRSHRPGMTWPQRAPERAARGPRQRARNHAPDRRQPAPPGQSGARQRIQQRPCVGMLRCLERPVDIRFLDDLAHVDCCHVVNDLGHHAEIMDDRHHRHPYCFQSSEIRSRICACVVTFSAMVGSSPPGRCDRIPRRSPVSPHAASGSWGCRSPGRGRPCARSAPADRCRRTGPSVTP